MKLQIKETYKVNGIEYTSLEEAKKAAGIVSSQGLKIKNNEKTIIKPFQIIDVSNYKISEYMGKMSLTNAESLAKMMSNESIKFWVPNYSEMNALVQNGKTENWKDHENYWTSSIFEYSTYIFYNSRLKKFEDIFPDIKLGVRFLFKES